MKQSKALVLMGVAAAAIAFSSLASATVLTNWNLNLGGGAGNTVGELLDVTGASYIDTTATSTSAPGSSYTFTNNGVFRINDADSGATNLNLGSGQLTAVFSGATGTGTLGGSFAYNAGGALDIYYNAGSAPFGSDANNTFEAAVGTKIATFNQVAGGGGTVDANGLPTANGNITAIFKAGNLAPGVWSTSGGTDLNSLLSVTFGYTTVNGSQLAVINPDLATALSGSSSTVNDAPNHFFLGNNGQFRLETTAVPEPSSIAILGLGLLGVGFMFRKKSRGAKHI